MKHKYTKEEKAHLEKVFFKLCEKATNEFPDGSFAFLPELFSLNNLPAEFIMFVGDRDKCKLGFDDYTQDFKHGRYVVVGHSSRGTEFSRDEISERVLQGGCVSIYTDLKVINHGDGWENCISYPPYDFIECILRNWNKYMSDL